MKVFLLLALLYTIATCAPCDIYARGGTPCVCAHSTVRALFDDYKGHLYQVARYSDGKKMEIGLEGSVANSTAQDDFCRSTTCNITVIYDQARKGNHLTVGTPGGANPRGNTPAKADAEAIMVGGKKVYSIYINPGEGYFHDGSSSGIPKGAEPGGIYMVTSGTHYNDGCCFDYGNGESNHRDNGRSHMNALYFGTSGDVPKNSGPYVQADLENGIFAWGEKGRNPNLKAFPNRFVTAMQKNNGITKWALKGGNAQEGELTKLWEGPLPEGYSPMHQEGGIILGTGGDDSSWSAGTFYEGAMTKGYPSDVTEDAVQQDIVRARYAA